MQKLKKKDVNIKNKIFSLMIHAGYEDSDHCKIN